MEQTEANGETIISSQPETTSTPWYGDGFKELVEKKGWKSGDDALKSYSELEKTFSGRVKMPTPESSAEEIRQFYQKTGCPENPDGYEIDIPEGVADLRNEAVEGELKKVAHEMGVSKQAFEAIVKTYYDKIATDMVKGRESGEAALKEEFGDKYSEQVTIAQRFAQNCSPEFRQVLEQTGLGNNPIIVKEFISLGKKTMSDSLIKGEAGNPDAKGYLPAYPDSPEMYRNGDDDDSKQSREYFTRKGYRY